MKFTRTLPNVEIAAHFAEKLGGIDSRLLTNWVITDVKVTHTPTRSGHTYVRVTLDNYNGVILFNDLRELEKVTKKKIRGAWNFAMMSSSQSKPKFSFCV